MSSYVVLARKWRPQQLADLTGQAHVARTLTNALEQGRVPHALLFTGARGVGKTSCARILAMALNCARGTSAHPCGECDSCREIQRGQSVDVLEIDGASNRGINEIRELRDGVRYAPNRDRYKVYIIDEVHMLTTEAFNALLKTLEEPPPHVVFIFATTEAQKIPVTILSRCQRFDFRRIAHADIVARLTEIATAEGLDIAPDVLGIVARQAAGGMRDALSLMDQVIAFAGTSVRTEDAEAILGAAERRRLFELAGALVDRDIERALRVVDEVDAFGVDISTFSMDLVAHLRDMAIVAVSRHPEALTALTDGEIAEARAQLARTDVATVHRMFELMVEAAEGIARSNHPRLLLEMALVRLAAIEPVHSIASLIERLEALAEGRALPPPDGGGPGSDGTDVPTPKSASGSTRSATPTGASTAAPSLAEAAPAPPAAPPATAPAAVAPPSETPPEPPVHEADAGAPSAAAATPHEAATTAHETDVDPPIASGVGELTSDAWRAIVNTMREEAPHAGELLASAKVSADGGDVRIAMRDGLMERVQPDLLERLNRLAAQLGRGNLAFRAVTEHEVDAETLAASYHVAGQEAAEQEARRAAARSYVTDHVATELVMNHFPGTRITRIEVPDARLENG